MACPTCAASVAKYEVAKGRCGTCRRRHLPYEATVRVGPFREQSQVTPLGQLVRSYKYHGREELGPLLGGRLVKVVTQAPWWNRVEAIVAVPTHWKHRLGRPFYAANALSRIVARQTGKPMAPVLRRVRGGPHQIGLNYMERRKNVQGAFALHEGVALYGARLLLIDDVKTTGATIEECAKVLRQGGAVEIYAAVVAGYQAAGSDLLVRVTTPTPNADRISPGCEALQERYLACARA